MAYGKPNGGLGPNYTSMLNIPNRRSTPIFWQCVVGSEPNMSYPIAEASSFSFKLKGMCNLPCSMLGGISTGSKYVDIALFAEIINNVWSDLNQICLIQ